MSKRKDRKFFRRIRARMVETGESYAVARMHLSKERSPEDTAQEPATSPTLRAASPPRFSVHLKLAALARPGVPSEVTPEHLKARRAGLLARLERELDRIASPRKAAELLRTVKGMDLDNDQLERLVRAYRTLPTGFMRQLELLVQQLRQLLPILEEVASAGALVQQVSELWRAAACLQPDAMLTALREFATQSIPIQLARSGAPELLARARQLLEKVDAVPRDLAWEEEAVSTALSHFDSGPVAAALQYANDVGPVAAALEFLENDAVTAAMRYLDRNTVVAAATEFANEGVVHAALALINNVAVSAAMRYFDEGPVAAARRMLSSLNTAAA